MAAKEIYNYGNSGTFGMFKKKSRSPSFRDPVGNFRNFEDRIDLCGYSMQFAFAFQAGQKIPQISISQNASSPFEPNAVAQCSMEGVNRKTWRIKRNETEADRAASIITKVD